LKNTHSLLLDGWDSLTARNDRGEDVTFHCNAEGKWDDIEEQEIGGFGRRSLSRENASLHSGAVRNSLIGVDAL
jgi:hypothetical protein